MLWTNPSLYLTDCLAAMGQTHDVRIVYSTGMPLPDHARVPGATARKPGSAESVEIDPRTEVLLVGGWRNRQYLTAARRAPKHGAVPILAFDTQGEHGIVYKIGAKFLGAALRTTFRGAFVPGSRQEQTARDLGFRSDQIQQGLYACARGAAVGGVGDGAPFIWVGRLVPVKALGTFIDAYEIYRRRVGEEARGARIIGDGVDRITVTSRPVPGLEWLGQQEPKAVRDLMRESACLVSSSTKEPWGMVIAEAAAEGLPVVCTDAAGAGDHLVRDGVNGRVVPAGDAEALADALVEIGAADPVERQAMREHSFELAAVFTAEAWPGRLLDLAQRVKER